MGFLAVSAAITLGGCAGDGTGLDANGRPVQPGQPANSDFQEIQDTIFTPICSVCHAGANAPQGLRLDAGNSYALLVNVASAEVPGTMRVNPGNPDASYIVQKIEGTAAVGVRMPANGPPYLPQDRIDLVRRWIAAGAPVASAPADRLVVSSTIPAVSRNGGARARQAHRDLQRALWTARASAPNRSRCATRSDEPVALRACRGPAGSPERGRDHGPRIRSPRAATSSPCTATAPRRSPGEAGHVLDGDADGRPGGDSLIPFDVDAGADR